MAQPSLYSQPSSRTASGNAVAPSLPFTSTPDFITASRLVPRLQASILPSSLLLSANDPLASSLPSAVSFQAKANPYHRRRLLQNVEHARTLLSRLEHSAQEIRIQSHKRDAQRRISEWRATVRELKAEIEEWARIYGDNAWYQNGQDEQKEDLLAKYGRNKRRKTSTEDAVSQAEATSPSLSSPQSPTQTSNSFPPPDSSSPSSLQPSRLRRRRNPRDSPNNDSSESNAHTTSSSTSKQDSSPTTEQQLSQDSSLQMSLTDSMAQLATQLKLSAQSFSNQLTIDTKLLDSAAEGLEKNVTGMDAAGKRMGMLKRMSEGKGWWGRMMLYAWIFGLWVALILVVGLGPKFRF